MIDPDPGYTTWLKGVKWNKSWIAFDRRTLQQPLTEGNKLEVTLEYYLDAADHYQTTTLQLEALGPRVPKPNAPQPVSFEDTQHLWDGKSATGTKVPPRRYLVRVTARRQDGSQAQALAGLSLVR